MKHSQVLTVILITVTALAAFQFYPIQAQSNSGSSWTTLSPMLTPRGGFGMAVVNGKIYAIGGLNSNNQALNTMEAYNPQTNEWVTMAPMPTPRSGFAVAVYQNKIYCIGGTIGNNAYIPNNEVFDVATNTWQTKSSMPTPRADLSASVIDGKIYLIGGKHYSSVTPNYNETNINEVYDPATDIWSVKNPMPTGAQGYASVVFENKIYVLGGSRQPNSVGNIEIIDSNQVYDAQSDTWSLAAKLPNAISYGAATVTEGSFAPLRIYLIGGFTEGQFSGKTIAYNPQTNTWITAETMPTPRAYLSLAEINDVLYAIGGFDGENWLGTIEQFKPIGYGKVPPTVQILSPENKTYTQALLHFTVNRATNWIAYSIDNSANVTIKADVELSGLIDGGHFITVYANDSQGNIGVSNTVYFSIDTIPPQIEILSPQNSKYSASDIQLTFIVNENVSSLSYLLDQQRVEKISGNVTLAALSNGQHQLTVYAVDMLGNKSELSVDFEVATFPLITVVGFIAIGVIISSTGVILFMQNRERKAKKFYAKSLDTKPSNAPNN
jgi:N-acetylneuraminic acid mutarotase